MKFLIVDDHSLIRDAVSSILRAVDPAAVVFAAADAVAAEATLDAHHGVDLVLLDIQLPGTHGFDLLIRWRTRWPSMAVVMLSGHRERALVRRALALGASGYIPKTDSCPVMTNALRLVLSGGIYVPPEAIHGGNEDTDDSPEVLAPPEPDVGGSPVPGLTSRQLAVLNLMMQGKSNKHICRALNLAEPTVKNHVSAILRVLGVASRAEAIVLVNRRHWSAAPGTPARD